MIASLILDTLRKFPTIEEIHSQTFFIPLQIAILERNPGLYITDGDDCIQVFKSKNTQHDLKPRPFNNLNTLYYIFEQKLSRCFDFIDDDLINQDSKFSHAYQPQYHFKDHFQSFLKVRKTCKRRQEMEYLEIKKWSIRIVNINRSGYYAPIILLHKYKSTSNNLEVSRVNSILYHQEIRLLLQRLRCSDMHEFFQDKLPNILDNKPSLFYHRRCTSSFIMPSSNLSFARADREGEHLKFMEGPCSYIPYGKMSGICRFMKPLPNYIEEKMKINFNQLPELNKREESNHDFSDDFGSLWSDEQEGFITELRRPTLPQKCEENESQEDSEEEYEVLKELYKNQMKRKQLL